MAQIPTETGSLSLKWKDRGLPVFGIYDFRYGVFAPVKDPALAIAVWEDGLVIFSEALPTGQPYFLPAPLRKGDCDPRAVQACLAALDQCRFFELDKTLCFGPDSSFIEMHALSAHKFQRLASWHDYSPRFGQPNEDFKRAWACAKEAILQLVPKESEPLDASAAEVLNRWSITFHRVAGVIETYRGTTKALHAYLERNGAPPPALEDLAPQYVDKLPLVKLPSDNREITRNYVREVEGAEDGSRECQILIHYPPHDTEGYRSKFESAIYRPSERYPAEFQGHKTHVYGGWAFTLYGKPSN